MKRVEVLKSITITLHNGDTITLQDEAGKLYASAAFADFMAYRIIKCEDFEAEGETTYVPFHSVLKVVVTETKTETEFEDDTCVTTEG